MAVQDPPRMRAATLNIDETARDPLSLHWSAIFAGSFVALLVYFMLMSLGLAFGASAIRDVFQTDESFNGIAIGAGVWTIAAVLISLFIGSYASGRASGIIATRIGYTQGAVITALFFAVMISQVGAGVGILTRGLANISSSTVSGAANLVENNPRLSGVIEDSLGDMDLQSEPSVVVTGLAQRLMRGDTESARNYLAAQAGLSPDEAQARIDRLSAQFKSTLADVGQKTAKAASGVGWASFVTILLGTIAAMLGGGTGAMVNLRKPIDRVDERAFRRTPAYT